MQSCEIEWDEARLTCIHPAHGRPVPVNDVIDARAVPFGSGWLLWDNSGADRNAPFVHGSDITAGSPSLAEHTAFVIPTAGLFYSFRFISNAELARHADIRAADDESSRRRICSVSRIRNGRDTCHSGKAAPVASATIANPRV